MPNLCSYATDPIKFFAADQKYGNTSARHAWSKKYI